MAKEYRTHQQALYSQLTVFKDAVYKQHFSPRKERGDTATKIIMYIHESPAFQKAASILKKLAEDDDVDVINIVISDYGSTLTHTPPLGIMQERFYKRTPLLDKIYRGCWTWTKRNDKVARFILSNRHYPLCPNLENIQSHSLFHGVFSQDQRNRFAFIDFTLMAEQAKCQKELNMGISKSSHMKYIMTRALLQYVHKFNVKNKPIRVHVFDDKEAHKEQIVSACLDCARYNVKEVYLANLKSNVQQGDYIGTTSNVELPTPYSELQLSQQTLVEKMDKFKKHKAFMPQYESLIDNIRQIRNRHHFVHDPIEVEVCKIVTRNHGKARMRRSRIITNTEYIDHLFHEVHTPDRPQTQKDFETLEAYDSHVDDDVNTDDNKEASVSQSDDDNEEKHNKDEKKSDKKHKLHHTVNDKISLSEHDAYHQLIVAFDGMRGEDGKLFAKHCRARRRIFDEKHK